MIDAVVSFFNSIFEYVVKLFPSSPFRSFINSLGTFPYLGWLNWFFPVGQCLGILAVWLTAIGVFYLWSVVARWVKLIGD